MPRPNSAQRQRKSTRFQRSSGGSRGVILAFDWFVRLIFPVLIGIVLLSARTSPERARIPTLAADAVTIREVRRESEIGASGDSRDAFVVERPAGARQGATSSVFVVDADGVLLRRVEIEYGHASPPLIQVVRGVQPGDRIIVSDMRAWDAFERLRLRWR